MVLPFSCFECDTRRLPYTMFFLLHIMCIFSKCYYDVLHVRFTKKLAMKVQPSHRHSSTPHTNFDWYIGTYLIQSTIIISIFRYIVDMLKTDRCSQRTLSFSTNNHIRRHVFEGGDRLRTRFGSANHLALVACFISYKKWMQREKSIHLRHIYLTPSKLC